ncbi:hypothetical protein COCOBI_08-3620 [Coccomyxa sp. Obi]|nr:hypothetical protein COCOBI_08-3620 [Coccomyxa sp. Obi]
MFFTLPTVCLACQPPSFVRQLLDANGSPHFCRRPKTGTADIVTQKNFTEKRTRKRRRVSAQERQLLRGPQTSQSKGH